MKTLLLALMLTLASTSVMAGWTKLGKTEDGTYTHYVDFSTIRNNGTRVKMWSLNDYTNIQTFAGYSFLSVTNLREYDCHDGQIRLLYYSWHSLNMGSGDVVYVANRTQDWSPVTPDSIGETQWKIACGKM